MPRLSRVLFPLLLSASLIGLAACGKSAGQEEHVELAPVRAVAATTGPSAPSIRTNGLLANEDEIRLSFKVGGVIRTIHVQPGDQVTKGQRLAEIELTEVNAQVEQARQLASKAQRDFERGERLYNDQVISLEQLQDLRTQASVQKAALQSAECLHGGPVLFMFISIRPTFIILAHFFPLFQLLSTLK